MNMSFDLHPAPRVLHVDPDEDSAVVLATLLAPEIQVVHAASYGEAQNQLQRGEFALLVIDPDLVPAIVNLANIHYARDEMIEAQALYERAIGLDPDCFEAHFNLGNILSTTSAAIPHPVSATSR